MIEEIRIHRNAQGIPTRVALYARDGKHVGDLPCIAFSIEGASADFSRATLEVHGFRVKIVDEA